MVNIGKLKNISPKSFKFWSTLLFQPSFIQYCFKSLIQMSPPNFSLCWDFIIRLCDLLMSLQL
jgi:hypothetical protein